MGTSESSPRATRGFATLDGVPHVRTSVHGTKKTGRSPFQLYRYAWQKTSHRIATFPQPDLPDSFGEAMPTFQFQGWFPLDLRRQTASSCRAYIPGKS
jgi:hypothetical protein